MYSDLDSHRFAQRMITQSISNYSKWGDQERYVLMSVLMEEVGEVCRAILDTDHTSQDCVSDIERELIDVGAVLFQLMRSCEKHYGGVYDDT